MENLNRTRNSLTEGQMIEFASIPENRILLIDWDEYFDNQSTNMNSKREALRAKFYTLAAADSIAKALNNEQLSFSLGWSHPFHSGHMNSLSEEDFREINEAFAKEWQYNLELEDEHEIDCFFWICHPYKTEAQFTVNKKTFKLKLPCLLIAEIMDGPKIHYLKPKLWKSFVSLVLVQKFWRNILFDLEHVKTAFDFLNFRKALKNVNILIVGYGESLQFYGEDPLLPLYKSSPIALMNLDKLYYLKDISFMHLPFSPQEIIADGPKS